MPIIARLAAASVLTASAALAATPAKAGGSEAHRYGHEAGHGPTVADVFGSLLGLPVYHGAPVGTLQNPAPVCPPAVYYRVQRGPYFNTPPAPTDTYRVISDCN